MVKTLQASLTDSEFTKLKRMVESNVYLEKICSEFSKQYALIEKSRKQAIAAENAAELAWKQQQSIYPKIKEIGNECMQRKKYMEEEISKKYNNRPVHIMGQFIFT